jgi:hypothetical protein
MRRHFEQFNDRFFDREVDQVFQAPTHGGKQLIGWNIRHFKELKLVSFGAQHGGNWRLLQFQITRV